MRKFLLLSLVLLAASGLISQNLNVAEHIGIDKTGEMVSVNSKVFYLGSSQSNCCGTNIYLRGCNDDGSLLFVKGLQGMPLRYFGKLIRTKDNSLFLNYWTQLACDLIQRQQYIEKVDTNGTLLFSAAIPTASGFSQTIVDITQHPDSSYYLTSPTDIYHYSSSGQFISKINSGLTGVSSILALNNGNLLLNGDVGGARQNVIMSTSGIILSQQICSDFIMKFIETPVAIFARTAGNIIEKYDLALIAQGTSTLVLSAATHAIKDFTERNDSLFVVGNYGSTQPFYAVLNSNLNLLYQTQSGYKGIRPTGISVNNRGGVHIITSSSSKTKTEYSYTNLYRLNLAGVFTSRFDIGVIGLSNLNTGLIGNGIGQNAITPYLNLDVTIKNFGQDTVKSFYLNHYAYINSGISYCYVLLHKLCQTSIAPGSMITVSTGSFYGQPFYLNPPDKPFDSKKMNVCLFTSVPNESNDIEIDNDAFCDSVLFTVTDLEENSLLSQKTKVYPNPFTNDFTVSSEFEIKTLEIINALGNLIRKEIIYTKEYRLNDSSLPSGIYFLKLETERGQTLQKLVKQ